METGERLLDSLQHEPEAWPQSNYRAQLIPSGPFVGGDCIQQSLLLAIYQARHHLVLTTPYFVPDDPLAAALSSAAARGVQVQLVLPARNDSLMANYACNAFMEELLEAGWRSIATTPACCTPRAYWWMTTSPWWARSTWTGAASGSTSR